MRSLIFPLTALLLAVLLLLILLARYWIQHVQPLPVAAQEHYVPTSPTTTPVITELDP